MHATGVIAALMLAIGAVGCSKPQCRNGTVLVTASFDSASSGADSLDVSLTYDGKSDSPMTIPGPAGKTKGTIEVEFPGGYGAGKSLHVAVSALQGGHVIGTGSADTTLSSGCTALTLAVTGGGGGDLGVGDMNVAADMLTLPIPVVASKPDLVGFPTTLDGSGSSDPLGKPLTYAWSIQSAPMGSTTTSAALVTPKSAMSSFHPDLGGVYMVELTVATSDGRKASATAAVTVQTIPIFYNRYAQTSTAVGIGPRVMRSDGTGDHDIGCPFVTDMGINSIGGYVPFLGFAYQPPPMSTGMPLFAFEKIKGSSAPPELWVGSAMTDCASSPAVRVDSNAATDHLSVAPRFSPNGKRIAYVNMPTSNNGSYTLVTVGVDGSNQHIVRSNTGSTYLGFTPPVWVDDTTLAWLEPDSTNTNPFTIYKAPDSSAAGDPTSGTRTQLLRCDQGTRPTDLYSINQFAITPFGIIAAGSTSSRSEGLNSPPPPVAAVSLYKLGADCQTTNAVTLSGEPFSGLAWDFDISPDGTSILFSSTHDDTIPDGGVSPTAAPQTDIFIVPADGSSAPHKIAGDPLYDDIGPRYTAAGRQFVWTRSMRGSDMAGMAAAIMIANADGTSVRAFQSSTVSGETVLYTEVGASRGFDCSWAPGTVGSSGGTLLVLAVILLVGLYRRRRA